MHTQHNKYYRKAHFQFVSGYVTPVILSAVLAVILCFFGLYAMLAVIFGCAAFMIFLSAMTNDRLDTVSVSHYGHRLSVRNKKYKPKNMTGKQLAYNVQLLSDIRVVFRKYPVFDGNFDTATLDLILQEAASRTKGSDEISEAILPDSVFRHKIKHLREGDSITLEGTKFVIFIKVLDRRVNKALINTLPDMPSKHDYNAVMAKHRFYYVSVQRRGHHAVKRGWYHFLDLTGRAVSFIMTYSARFIFVLIVAVLGFGAYKVYDSGIIDEISSCYSYASTVASQSSYSDFAVDGGPVRFYDDSGNILLTLNGSIYPPLQPSEIPDTVKKAITSVEDRTFYEHNGFDVKAIVRAAVSYVRSGHVTQGGSTITQQLVKNVYLSSEQSIDRKLKEIFISYFIEQMYSKDELLAAYLNNCYFANGMTGLDSASHYYFNKAPKDLSLAEASYILSIPNSPSKYDPVKHPENTKKRQKHIIDSMTECGYITAPEADKVYAIPIHLAKTDTDTDIASEYGLRTYLINSTVEDIMLNNGFVFKSGFNTDAEKATYQKYYKAAYSTAERVLYNGNLDVYTTINLKAQEALIDASSNVLSHTDDDVEAASTIMDAKKHTVIAMLPGRIKSDGTFDELNRGADSYRQPGSSIKPVVDYTPAFDRLDMTPDTIINDHAIKNGPKNSGGHYSGDMTILSAVTHSVNTVAWQIYEKLTPKVGYRYLSNMMFTGLEPEDKTNMAVSIGGLTKGVSTEEMAGAYSAIATDGKWTRPVCIKKINFNSQRYYSESYGTKQVYSADAASMMRQCLENAVRYGTGHRAAVKGAVTGGKTGTTNDSHDGWFNGYVTKDGNTYVCSVWVGCDMPRTVAGLQGGTYPAEIFNKTMSSILTIKE